MVIKFNFSSERKERSTTEHTEHQNENENYENKKANSSSGDKVHCSTVGPIDWIMGQRMA
jgi:hypothetical protein